MDPTATFAPGTTVNVWLQLYDGQNMIDGEVTVLLYTGTMWPLYSTVQIDPYPDELGVAPEFGMVHVLADHTGSALLLARFDGSGSYAECASNLLQLVWA